MYQVDGLDKVIELTQAPKPDIGAPIPVVLADEQTVVVAYYSSLPDLTATDPAESSPRAIVLFRSIYATMFGPPNDEAFQGHPLYKRGLRPYGCYEIEHSSWIRSLEIMNRIHPSHNKEEFLQDNRHFIWVFHDSTFECIAQDYVFEQFEGTTEDLIAKMSKLIK